MKIIKLSLSILLLAIFNTQISAACVTDLKINKWDCMLALSGTVYCGYKDYDVLRATSPSGPFVKIGTHDVSEFYIVPDHGYYKLKVVCKDICHESNVVHYGYDCEAACDVALDTPFPEGSTVKHCYNLKGKIHFDASDWVEGCSSMAYKWITPSGIVTGSVLHGDYGYGAYQLKVICLDTKCHHEELKFWFAMEEDCHIDYCHFDVEAPFESKDYCYDTDGDLWLSAATWVKGCSKANFKWITPIGIVHGPILEGKYGYGSFSLKSICHTNECYYEEVITTFEINATCGKHCSIDLDAPIDDKIKHCYSSEGNIWMDAKTWVNGCQKVHYKWETPLGLVDGSALDGEYGYGKYTLTVVCHDAVCYHEKASVSFILLNDCKKPYHIYCPEDKWVECDADLHDLSKYSSPYYIHHGKKVWVEKSHVQRQVDECKRGYITRKWNFKDPNGYWHSCSQDIFVGQNEHGKLKIDWPESTLELEGCNPSLDPDDLPDGYQKPQYYDSSCSKLGHSYKDQEFYYHSTCKKVVRTWSVIDWCVYNPNKDLNKGKYIFHQTIKINSDDSPIVDYDNEIEVTAADCETVSVQLADLEVNAESCGDKFYVTNDSPYATSNRANASGDYPIGTTEVIYTVSYGCGYKKNYLQKITVVSDGVLRAYCEAQIVIPLHGFDSDGDGVNDYGEALIWAKDFDLGSSDLCGGEVYHSFSPDSLVMSKAFTCNELGINELVIYISDDRDQKTSCTVEVHVQNNAANIENCVRQADVQDDDQPEDNSEDQGSQEEEEEEEEANDEDDDGEDDDGEESSDEDATNDDEEYEDEDQNGGDDSSTSDDDHNDDVQNEDSDDDYDTSLGGISGLVTTHYGLPLPSVEIALHKMESVETDEAAFQIVESVVDSFYSRSGALIYILEHDTVYLDPIIEESMVIQEITVTDESGTYGIDDIVMHEHYMLAPVDEQIDNSHININDANRLYAHLSGLDPFTDSYALLAADINGSGDVDFDDLDDLLAFINGEQREIGQIPMIFVDVNYQFENPNEPWDEDYSTQREIENMEDANYIVDFIAITIGDLVQDDVSESASATTTRSRSQDALDVIPNPFYSETSLTVNIESTQIAKLELFALDGSKIYERTLRLAEGRNEIPISNQDLSRSGIYIYQLKTDKNHYSGRLLKLQ